MVSVFIVAVGTFLLGGFLESERDVKYFGVGFFIARGARFAGMVMLFFCVTAISRDLLTILRCRECLGTRCTVILNEHIFHHKLFGILLFVFSLIHTVGHLFGSVATIASE